MRKPKGFIGLLAIVCVAAASYAVPGFAQQADAPPAAGQKTDAKPQEAPVRIQIGYLKREIKKPLPISRLDYPARDDGIAGANLGIQDNNTTGRFLKQEFTLAIEQVPDNGDIVAVATKLVDGGSKFILVDAPAADILAVSDALKGKEALVFNISATDVDLRQENCRANVMHLAPSRDMLADALAQYLVWKKWNRWFLVEGALPPDKAMGEALRRAAKRFGAKIVEEREYKEAAGASRTDTGHELIQAQMPVFTQNARDHDVLVVADESDVFGAYLPYRTWDAKPVAGTAGLVPSSWHEAHEQWGATQFQNRFDRIANNRKIRPVDFHAWLALRVIGEAAQRERSADFTKLRDYISGPKLSVAAFKGQALTFRPWNNQMRQPIVVGSFHLPVTWSPQPGFLHQVTALDTLGVDQPETKCKF
jgi:ABC transporter substrate binding protein (PQQ-dependent alcohol dehydrogenase system)